MPSPEHAADLERVLTRAAEECESGVAWFGDGLPRALKRAVDTTGRSPTSSDPDLAFVEVGAKPAELPRSVRRIIALSTRGLDELTSLVQLSRSSEPPVTRLICPVAVLDFTTEGVRVREIRHGLTAADLQEKLETTLWSGPDLKELGSH